MFLSQESIWTFEPRLHLTSAGYQYGSLWWKSTTGIVLSEPTGPGSGGDLSLSTERGRIGKPVMPPRSGLVVRNARRTHRRPMRFANSLQDITDAVISAADL